MTGKKMGVVARLKRLFPSLIAIHCIAHREALAAKDVADQFAEMEYLDKLAGQVYTWLGKYGNQHAEFSKLLKEFQIHDLKILQLHKVRWLSRGLVMARIIEVTGENAENAESGSLEDCKDIAKQHVQHLLQALDTGLGDLEVFKAMKFFEPVGYPDLAGRRCESTSLWLKTLFEHFTVGAVDPLTCYAEREGFVETLYNACPHKSMLGAWRYCISDVSYSKDGGLLNGK
ncbi:hypothetical protein L7F22_055653 [Adiantum nelumboides]|nr:hypothetical protein [Adiantum nelumboides]